MDNHVTHIIYRCCPQHITHSIYNHINVIHIISHSIYSHHMMYVLYTAYRPQQYIVYTIIYRGYMMWIACIYIVDNHVTHIIYRLSMLSTSYNPHYICTCVTHTIYCIVYGIYPQHISHSIYPHHMMYVLSTSYRPQYIKSYTVSIWCG